MVGPLHGVVVADLSRLAPGPYCSMCSPTWAPRSSASSGRAGRPDGVRPTSPAAALHPVDLKRLRKASPRHAARRAGDGLLEGFRPGVMERLGLGPEVSSSGTQARLRPDHRVRAGRPLAGMAGHDINYLALAGVLAAIGHQGERARPSAQPRSPTSGAGACWPLRDRVRGCSSARSGQGQIVDAAMVDGPGRSCR